MRLAGKNVAMVHAWFDLTAGVAGDMLLGALFDAGADRASVQTAVDAVVPGAVRLDAERVQRAGQQTVKARVRVLAESPHHRRWADLRQMLTGADLPAVTKARALATFERLALAEADAHGVSPDEVHFHEVGALDSIADVVGVCEALRTLDVTSVSASPIAVGSGRVKVAHGDLPVPVPAVARLMVGWRTSAVSWTEPACGSHHKHHHDHEHHHHDHAHHHHDEPAPVTTPGEVGELATPTGVALIRSLASRCESLPSMDVTAVGVGAGGKDFATHPNVVRVMIGATSTDADETVGQLHSSADEALVELRANVDDLDPRLWPGVIDACLAAGAVDAWLTSIHMKKGRPAFTVHALVAQALRDQVTRTLFTHTTTLGVRGTPVTRAVLDRHFIALDLGGQPLTVKVGSQDGVVVHAAAEFDSLAEVAASLGRPQAEVSLLANAAIVAAGLVPGAAVPTQETR